jgi:natural product precursor
MKTLKLNALASENLSKVEMNQVKGGVESERMCKCGCAYANSGGSSVNANCSANYYGGDYGLSSSGPILCIATPSR